MQQLQRQVMELQTEIDKLKSSATIPHDVEQALRERLQLRSINSTISIVNSFINSTKSNTSENQSVNEAGTNTYTVMKNPDDFLQITLADGSTYYIPVFTS